MKLTTFTTLFRKLLSINGARAGNRQLVIIAFDSVGLGGLVEGLTGGSHFAVAFTLKALPLQLGILCFAYFIPILEAASGSMAFSAIAAVLLVRLDELLYEAANAGTACVALEPKAPRASAALYRTN